MRVRSKVLLVAGLSALTTGAFAGAAAADRGHNSLGKVSKKGHSVMKVEVNGTVTAFTAASATAAGSVTVSAGSTSPTDGLAWTCAIPMGSTVTAAVNDTAKMKCRSADGVLTATKLRVKSASSPSKSGSSGRHGDDDDHKGDDRKRTNHKRGSSMKVEVEARGVVTAIAVDAATQAPTSITVDPGTAGVTDTLPNVTCAVSTRTRILGTPQVGDTVKIDCKVKKGVLTAKKIKEKGLTAPGGLQVEVKGNITTLPTAAAPSIAIGAVSCAVPAGFDLTGFAVNDFVEAKCTGNPLTLVRIHHED